MADILNRAGIFWGIVCGVFTTKARKAKKKRKKRKKRN